MLYIMSVTLIERFMLIISGNFCTDYILDRIRRARNHLYLSATPMDELRIDQRAFVLYGPSAVSI